jgi:hypothetical protein
MTNKIYNTIIKAPGVSFLIHPVCISLANNIFFASLKSEAVRTV